MCGRFYVDEMTEQEMRRIVDAAQKKLSGGLSGEFAEELIPRPHGIGGGREVFPSDCADILMQEDGRICIRTMRWGFPGRAGGPLVINARAETLLERPMFRNCFPLRRCVIPAGKYYEWNARREKAAFWRADAPAMYFAGIYDLYGGEERFVIITTEANASVRPVHDRMPLLLEEDETEQWLGNEIAAERLLKKLPAPLVRSQAYEQLSLFDIE